MSQIHQPQPLQFLDIARGLYPDSTQFTILGKKENVSASLLDDITEMPGVTRYSVPASVGLEIVSSSGTDSDGGIGINKVDITYLDASGLQQTEIVTLDGTTPVLTAATDITYIQWMHAETVGANSVAVGNITLRGIGGGTTYEYISAGGNQSLSCRYKVPATSTGYIMNWKATAVAKIMDLRLRATVDKDTRSIVSDVFLFQDVTLLNNAASGLIDFKIPLRCPAGTEIKVSGQSDTTGGDASASFQILLQPQDTATAPLIF